MGVDSRAFACVGSCVGGSFGSRTYDAGFGEPSAGGGEPSAGGDRVRCRHITALHDGRLDEDGEGSLEIGRQAHDRIDPRLLSWRQHREAEDKFHGP